MTPARWKLFIAASCTFCFSGCLAAAVWRGLTDFTTISISTLSGLCWINSMINAFQCARNPKLQEGERQS